MEIDNETRNEIEAAVFRRLVSHLADRTDLQNIELMDLAGFCRNCLSKWYLAEVAERGESMDYDQVREHIYRMPYSEWKENYQKEI